MKTTHMLLSVLLLAACGGEPQNTETTAPGAPAEAEAGSAKRVGTVDEARFAETPSDGAKIELFVMSRCPYGVEVEKALHPVKEKLGDSLEVSIDFIGGGSAGSLTSMHGDAEVAGDMSQLCTLEVAPEAFLDMVACQNEDPRSIGSNWERCASDLGIDGQAISECMNGSLGQELLAASFARSAHRGAQSSPTIFLQGKPYMGGRSTMALMRGICGSFDANAPAACADVPEPVVVEAIFLSDTRCEECDIHELEPKLKSTLAGLHVRHVDYSTEEGRALYQELHAAEPTFVALPAVLLDPAVERDPDAYRMLARYLRPVGDYRELRIGGKFDPTAEICDNGIDDDDDGAVDCHDQGCKATLTCREEVAGKLDLFVMSHCPYGAAALIATHDVAPHFGDDMDLTVHYIGGASGDRLSSMHGQGEVDDDVREICAQKHFPDEFMAFNACISRNYKSADWKACAGEAGIDASTIQSCFEGEGNELLAASFAEAEALGIGASPTFLVNNKRIFQTIDAGDVQRQFCRDNAGLAGCSATVEATAEAPPPDGSCGG